MANLKSRVEILQKKMAAISLDQPGAFDRMIETLERFIEEARGLDVGQLDDEDVSFCSRVWFLAARWKGRKEK